jgi:hypothetical protein
VAVNALFGDALPEQQLVLAGLKSEGTVSGYHADNIAPAIMGGFTLVRWAGGALPLPLWPATPNACWQAAVGSGFACCATSCCQLHGADMTRTAMMPPIMRASRRPDA